MSSGFLRWVGLSIVLATATAEGAVRAAEPASRTRPATAAASRSEWPGWGGPNGDFKVDARGLVESWPPEGPPVLWSRPLGEGYSAIVAAGGGLYTQYRDKDEEIVVALDAADGSTRWEHRYRALPREGNVLQFGKGPNATPLLLGDRIVTLGYTGVLNALDRSTGKVLWSHDLVDDFGGSVLEFGYAASPIEHDGNVIVLVGGSKHGVVAFSPEDGSVAWSGKPSSVSYATPIVIDLDGQQQIVYFSADEIIGADAGDGTRLWSFPVANQYGNNATGPLWGEDGLLWVATQLDGGTRTLRLTRRGTATKVEEVWSSDRMSIHFWNTLRLDDTVYASIGSNASILAAIDIETGDIRWRERGFEQANFVHTPENTVLLDGNGHLALARLGPDGIEILTETRFTEGPTWTVPTLVGTKLFIRDKITIRALELGRLKGSTEKTDTGS